MNEMIEIGNTVIKEDQNGRYRLNDLHQAAGGEQRHKPKFWLRLEKTKELIQEICEDSKSEIPAFGNVENPDQGFCKDSEGEISPSLIGGPVSVIRGGENQGTYVTKELVYAYATWVSPKFFRHVLKVFEEHQNGSMVDLQVLAKLPKEIERLSKENAELREIVGKMDRRLLTAIYKPELKEAPEGYITVADAFEKMTGMKASLGIKQQIGKIATKITKGEGYDVVKLVGNRNCYPVEYAEIAIETLI